MFNIPGPGDYQCFPNFGHSLDPRNDFDPCECGECPTCIEEMKAAGLITEDA